MRYTPRAELEGRIARLQALLVANNMDCVLVRQNTHLYYFAGTIQNAHLFIPATGKAVLMVRRDYTRARIESQLETVIPLRSLRQLPDLLKEYGISHLSNLGLEFDVLPTSLYLGYGELFSGTRLVDASSPIRQTRSIKSPWEVARIEEAAEQVDLMFRTVRNNLREGISEIELEAEMERVGRLRGHQGLIRQRTFNSENVFGYLISGPNSAVPAHTDSAGGGVGLSPALGQGAGYRRIGRGEPVYMDVSGCVDGYVADQTRVLVVGPVPERVRKIYEDMREIYARLRDVVRAGVRCCDVYDTAIRLAEEMGHGEFFMGGGDARLGFVGHGVGLELDEPPAFARSVATPIEEGMVLAIEPKVIVPGLGAIGIENSHLVTKDGLRTLTISDEELAVV